MLKVELHTHTADDPVDPIPYTTCELIDRAAALGYDALAVTLHDRELNLDPWKVYAETRGIVLIHGIERTIKGRHVLLLNFPRGTAECVTTFEDLARLKRAASGLVVAPHPFFPGTTSLWSRLEQHAQLFDAVERNAMFVHGLDFNRAAERWARHHGKPMVGNGDVHRLAQLGTTYSLVDETRRHPDAICGAIAAGRVSVISRPLWPHTAARILGSMLFAKRPWSSVAAVRAVPRVNLD